MSQREEKMAELGFPIDQKLAPGAIYKPVVLDGTTAYVSGAVPINDGKLVFRGKVPSETSLEEAQKAAALCVANNLRMLYEELGSLDRVDRILRMTGYVNSDLDFTDQHLVINGASQLLLDVFGDDGLAARTAIGLASLPLGSSVETEIIVRVKGG